MTNPSENLERLYEVRARLQNLQNEWSEHLEDLKNAQEEMKNGDIFASIDYLTFCDQFCKNIHLDLREIDPLLKDLKNLQHEGKNLDLVEGLITDLKELREQKTNKKQNLEEQYSILSEQTLQLSQDVIAKFSETLEKDNTVPRIEAQINQNLEKTLFLQELRDSLETYRQAREDFISECELDTFAKLPENEIPEDLGEEKPEIDAILSQLDTAITSCDTALLIQETGD